MIIIILTISYKLPGAYLTLLAKGILPHHIYQQVCLNQILSTLACKSNH